MNILVISNHNSFRVLFDRIASVYSIWKKYFYIFALEMASPGNQHCANCVGHTFVPYITNTDRDDYSPTTLSLGS